MSRFVFNHRSHTSEVPVTLFMPTHSVRVLDAPPEQKMCPYASCKSRAVIVIHPKSLKSNSVGSHVGSMYDHRAPLCHLPQLQMRCSATSKAKHAVAPPARSPWWVNGSRESAGTAASTSENQAEIVFAPGARSPGNLQKWSEEVPACAQSWSRMADHRKIKSMISGAPREGQDL